MRRKWTTGILYRLYKKGGQGSGLGRVHADVDGWMVGWMNGWVGGAHGVRDGYRWRKAKSGHGEVLRLGVWGVTYYTLLSI